MQAQEQRLEAAFAAWWLAHESRLRDLAETNGNRLMAARAELLASFEAALRPIDLLDRFKVAGVIASWWEKSQYELRTLAAQGFVGVIDSWITTIKASLEDSGPSRNRAKFNILDHKLVIKLLPEYLAEIAEAEAEIGRWEQERAAFEQGPEDEADHPLTGDSDDEESEAPANYAQALEARLAETRETLKTTKKWLQQPELPTLAQLYQKASLAHSGEITPELLTLQAAALEQEVAELDEKLQPYREIKAQLNRARKKVKQLKERLLDMLAAARLKLDDTECAEIVLELARKELVDQLDGYVIAHRREVIAAVENWWDKYKVTLQDIEAEDNEVSRRLDKFIQGLGYA